MTGSGLINFDSTFVYSGDTGYVGSNTTSGCFIITYRRLKLKLDDYFEIEGDRNLVRDTLRSRLYLDGEGDLRLDYGLNWYIL